jgi:hypothetical protein
MIHFHGTDPIYQRSQQMVSMFASTNLRFCSTSHKRRIIAVGMRHLAGTRDENVAKRVAFYASEPRLEPRDHPAARHYDRLFRALSNRAKFQIPDIPGTLLGGKKGRLA